MTPTTILRRLRTPAPRPRVGRVEVVVVPARPGRRDRARRAAVAVVTGAVVALAAQVVLGVAVNTEVSPLRDPLYFDKLALLRAHPAFFAAADRPTTVLLVGSSRTLNAVNARRATDALTQHLGRPVSVFNFGQAGAGPVTNAVYLRRLADVGVKADFALIEVHPVFLAGQHAVTPEARWLLTTRLRPDELPVVRGMGFPAAAPPTHGPRGLFASVYEHRFLLLDRYAPWMLMDNRRLNGGHEPDAFGFCRPPDECLPKERAGLTHLTFAQYAPYFPGYRPTGCGVAAVRDTLEQCRARGIRPALVLMPECGGWESWYDAEGLKQLDALLASLSAEFAAPLVDARRWVSAEETMDGHHLTGRGADRFTDVLTRDALAPWLGGGR
ncbi:MAG: hypothetical protein U0804_10315 [Gemmataceae bacterium]